MTDQPQPTFKPDDFVIFSPSRAASLNDASMPGDRFYLLSVVEDKNDTFDFDVLLDGPCALVEAIALSACKKGQRIWFPNEPFGDSKP